MIKKIITKIRRFLVNDITQLQYLGQHQASCDSLQLHPRTGKIWQSTVSEQIKVEASQPWFLKGHLKIGYWDRFEPLDSGREQSVSWTDPAVANIGKMN